MLRILKDLFSPPASRTATEQQKCSMLAAIAAGDVAACQALLQTSPRLAGEADPAGTPMLHLAARKQNLELVDLLLATGANIDQQDAKGATALHCAAFEDPDTAAALLNRGANIDACDNNGYAPIHRAVWRAVYACVSALDERSLELLIARGANLESRDKAGYTPLLSVCAIADEHIELDVVAAALLNATLDGSENVWQRGVRAATMLLESGCNPQPVADDGYDPITAAVRNGRRDFLQLLLDHGADPCLWRSDSCGLFVAVLTGRYDLADVMLAHGASIDLRHPNGMTLLHFAAETGHGSVLEYALSKDAEVDAVDDGATPLYLAASGGHNGMVASLLTHKANPDAAVADDGDTPLLAALREHHTGVARLLIEHGADLNRADSGQVTPLMMAAEEGLEELVQIMLDRGARGGTDARGR